MNRVSLELLEAVCLDIKNFFVRKDDVYTGAFTISNGNIAPSLPDNVSYFRVMGSRLNDGVHYVGDNDLTDESFEGVIWVMTPPKAFLSLVAEISAWQTANKSAIDSPYISESFGGYSYSKASAGTGAGTGVVCWQTQFKNRLNPYRRIRLV